MDGSNQLTIDDEHNAGNFSASPDGQQIAYGAGETAFLFNIGSGIEVFDPRAYGMDSPKGQVITSPSWSPGGDNIAWFVSGYFDGQDTQGFGIFDMFSKSFQLIHPFQSLGMDITPPPAIWSQDGDWIAITVFDQEPARSGVWLVNSLNPNQEIFMGTASSNPVFGPWREDQKLLTYFKFDQSQGDSKTWIYDLVSGEHQLAPLPSEAQVIAWR
jgi:Tol biopolymer transport system component